MKAFTRLGSILSFSTITVVVVACSGTANESTSIVTGAFATSTADANAVPVPDAASDAVSDAASPDAGCDFTTADVSPEVAALMDEAPDSGASSADAGTNCDKLPPALRDVCNQTPDCSKNPGGCMCAGTISCWPAAAFCDATNPGTVICDQACSKVKPECAKKACEVACEKAIGKLKEKVGIEEGIKPPWCAGLHLACQAIINLCTTKDQKTVQCLSSSAGDYNACINCCDAGGRDTACDIACNTALQKQLLSADMAP